MVFSLDFLGMDAAAANVADAGISARHHAGDFVFMLEFVYLLF
jgi:hypothetical protein